MIAPITTPQLTWACKCLHCSLLLLTTERAGFYCGPNGKHLRHITPLSPLPPEYNQFLNDPHISSLSRILNLLFSFASLETTQPFPDVAAGGTSFVAIQGKVYHHLRPSHCNSAMRWLLHDGFLRQNVPHHHYSSAVPQDWIDTLRLALMCVNTFGRHIQTPPDSLPCNSFYTTKVLPPRSPRSCNMVIPQSEAFSLAT